MYEWGGGEAGTQLNLYHFLNLKFSWEHNMFYAVQPPIHIEQIYHAESLLKFLIGTYWLAQNHTCDPTPKVCFYFPQDEEQNNNRSLSLITVCIPPKDLQRIYSQNKE